mmetsp:Transcript_25392/g.35149  ORF Transcript_25392/g.35149 Transcript_25392/m.35149 type:complete len:269 (+) Transcript_25392:2843-3649(+)
MAKKLLVEIFRRICPHKWIESFNALIHNSLSLTFRKIKNSFFFPHSLSLSLFLFLLTGKNMENFNFKVVLLGEGCVGKTSLVVRYVQNEFYNEHRTTIQASFLSKRINIDNARANIAIWDTAGQERFHALGPIYYRDADGALLVYDVTDQDSFLKVKNWVKELRKMLGKDIILCIAGNKIDLERNRTVSLQDAEAYAQSVGAKHFQTSAKQTIGVDEVFLDLTKRMIERARKENIPKKGANVPTVQAGATTSILIGDDEGSSSSSGCC